MNLIYKGVFFIFLFFSMILSSSSFADTLYMKNGKSMMGVVEPTEGGVMFEGMFFSDDEILRYEKNKAHEKGFMEKMTDGFKKMQQDMKDKKAKKAKEVAKKEKTAKKGNMLDIKGLSASRQEAIDKTNRRLDKIQQQSTERQAILDGLYTQ